MDVIWRTSAGDHEIAISGFDETGKSAKMRDEEIVISYQESRYLESRIC